MHKVYSIVYAFASLLLTVSCTEVVDFEVNEEYERVIIDGVLTTELKEHLVKVSTSTSLYNTVLDDPLTGLDVIIYEDNVPINLVEKEEGMYYTPRMQGKVGSTYRLEIAYDGELYEAEETIRTSVVSDSVAIVQPFREVPFEGTIDSANYIYLFAQETPGKGDCYQWEYFINGEPGVTLFSDLIIQNDEFVDGVSPQEGWELYALTDDLPISTGDTLVLKTYSAPSSYFDFYLTFMLNTEFRGSPFDGPPANVESNISNGAIGYFRVSDVSEATLIFGS